MAGMDELSRGRAVASMAPAWLAAAAGGTLVGLFAGDGYLTWLPVVMALCVLLAFGIQLALGMRPGLVSRLGGSLTGALGVLIVATIVLVALDPDGIRVHG